MDKRVVGIKSTTGTVSHIVKSIQSTLLRSQEELSPSPSSFLSLNSDTIGTLSAATFFESLAMKSESLKFTARKRRSLVRYLNAKEFTGIMGNPASFVFSIGFSLEDIINHSVNVSNTVQKMTIGKNTVMAISDNPNFILDYDIDIITNFNGDLVNIGSASLEEYTFYAKHVPGVSEVLNDISNPFIKSNIHIIEGKKYFIMNIPCRQYERRVEDIETVNSAVNPYEFDYSYTKNLYAFEVLYRKNKDSNWSVLNGEAEGAISTGYNYSLSNTNVGTKGLRIKFSRNPQRFSPETGSSIKIIMYLTDGSLGNFDVKTDENENAAISAFELVQDRNDPYQDCVYKMKPIIDVYTRKGEGGRDEMSVEELREYVTRKDDSKLMTLVELKAAAAAKRLRMTKERADVLEMYFRLGGVVENDDIVFSTTTGLTTIDMKKLPVSKSTGIPILSPTDIISLKGSPSYTIMDNPSSMEDYISDYAKNKVDNEFFFPFHMSLDLGSFVDTKVYNMFRNDVKNTIFEFYNETSTSEAGVDDVRIIRDPSKEALIDGKPFGTYNIVFDVKIGELMHSSVVDAIDNFETNPMMIHIEIVGGTKTFIVNPDNIQLSPIGGDTVRVVAALTTDSGVDDYGRIGINNYSLIPYPKGDNQVEEFYFVEKSDINIHISFIGGGKSGNSSEYEKIYSPNDRLLGYNISTVYRIEDVKFFDNLTNIIKPVIDIKLEQPTYARYPEDIPQLQISTEFDVDEHGEIVYVDKTIKGVIHKVPTILHRKGDIVKDETGKDIILHKVNDLIMDEDSKPTVGTAEIVDGELIVTPETTSEIICEVYELPLVDRIHSFQGYNSTIDAFLAIIEKIDGLLTTSFTGRSCKLSVMNTIGSGNYYFSDRTTGDRIPLDNMSLSLQIGMKLEDSVTDGFNSIINNVKRKMVKYISDNSVSEKISFVRMLDEIRDNTSGIKYFELYSVNNYPDGVCQSISSDDKSSTTNWDVLTIRNGVDIPNSDIPNGVVAFKPDISITIIK